ncbi:hypothetical protein [Actinomadura sp. CNU-125]|uniref:hypothetical protein n=1 Tax=Actinomadura sp. CNU-125 TaxID=1904961 RepID=UPI001178A5F5|nr:hypothetical protein [Actinomadura sp. CNU-125]
MITPDRLYTFCLAGGVVFFIYLTHGNVPRIRGGHDPEAMKDPEAMRRIFNIGYAQGLAHGAERARAEGGEGARTHAHLPKAG